MKQLLLILFLIPVLYVFGQEGYKVGDKAADFKLKNVNGNWVSLSEYSLTKGFVVIFTCNHCPYAKANEDRIIELHKKFEPLGYPVIAINSNDSSIVPEDSYSKMILRAKDKNFPFPYLLDNKHKTQETYGAARTPHVYLLQKKHDDLIVKYIGAIDDSPRKPDEVQEKYLENAIVALLEGKQPKPSYTKAIGCSIKKKK